MREICHCGLVGSINRNAEDVGSNPSKERYIMAHMTTYTGGPLSLGPSGRLKNITDVDKWSSSAEPLSFS